MLKIQEYLNSGNTIEDLKLEYDIAANYDPANDVYCFDYTSLSPKGETIAQEAKALVLANKTWDLVARSTGMFFDFFNIEQEEIKNKINWDNAYLLEKLDGIVVIFYYYNNKWNVATRYTANCETKAVMSNTVNHNLRWIDAINITLNDLGYTWKSFTSKLNKNIFYSFELCGPENHNGVNYSNRNLFLFYAYDNENSREININDVEVPSNIKLPDKIKVNSLEDIIYIIKSTDNSDKEGYVLNDDSGFRVKFIYSSYYESFYVMGGEINNKQENLSNLRRFMAMGAYSFYYATYLPRYLYLIGSISDNIISNYSLLNQTVMNLARDTNIYYQNLRNSQPEEKEKLMNSFFWREGLEGLSNGLLISDILKGKTDSEYEELIVNYLNYIK